MAFSFAIYEMNAFKHIFGGFVKLFFGFCQFVAETFDLIFGLLGLADELFLEIGDASSQIILQLGRFPRQRAGLLVYSAVQVG